jgi:hypothetical protein
MRKSDLIWPVLVAVVGLSTALVIYLNAAEDSDVDENVQVVVVDGQTYRIPLSDTKMYRGQLQRYGGQALVLFDDFNRWFAGFWRGRSLAITIGSITTIASIGLFLLARLAPSDPDDGDGDHHRRGASGPT